MTNLYHIVLRIWAILLAAAILPDVAVWTGIAGHQPRWLCVLFSLTTVFILFSYLSLHRRLFGRVRSLRLFFATLLCLVIPKLALVVSALAVGWRWGAVVALAVLAVAVFGFTAGRRALRIRHDEVFFKRLPEAFDGFRLLHISDWHLGTLGDDTSFTQKVVEAALDERPDMVAFTGDLINQHVDEAAPHIDWLRRLEAPCGVFAVMGNHDFYDNSDGKVQDEAFSLMVKSLGWHLLRDTHALISRRDDTIEVVGVDHVGAPPFRVKGNLSKAMLGTSGQHFKLLLTHDPAHWRREVLPTTDIDLTLSGHTHAGQLLIGPFSPVRMLYKEWGGWYEDDGRRLHVSFGLGGILPFRFGAWPEITLITLRRG